MAARQSVRNKTLVILALEVCLLLTAETHYVCTARAGGCVGGVMNYEHSSEKSVLTDIVCGSAAASGETESDASVQF